MEGSRVKFTQIAEMKSKNVPKAYATTSFSRYEIWVLFSAFAMITIMDQRYVWASPMLTSTVLRPGGATPITARTIVARSSPKPTRLESDVGWISTATQRSVCGPHRERLVTALNRHNLNRL